MPSESYERLKKLSTDRISKAGNATMKEVKTDVGRGILVLNFIYLLILGLILWGIISLF